MKNSIIIILSILLGIFSCHGINGFQANPTLFEVFSAVVFTSNAVFLFIYLINQIKD
jgi:hypothetical protein